MLSQGKLEQAEPLCLETLAKYESIMGPDHIGTLHALGLVARLRAEQGRTEEAREWYVRAIERRSDTLGPEHPLTLDARDGLVSLDAGQQDG